MDKTGLFHKQLPNHSYVRKSKAARSARGTESMKAKDSVTLYVMTNATGTVLVPLGMIGKSENPRFFTYHPKKLNYFAQKRRVLTAKLLQSGGCTAQGLPKMFY
jgi:hypothetical protein